MAGRIPEDFIETLLERTDIVEVISSRLQLKRAGREYHALCPFHNENTPSFTVSPDKQFYHCFGCGAHGTAVGFLMEYDGLEFPAAIEELASMAGLEVPRSVGSRDADRHTGMLGALAAAAEWFADQLPGADPAREYLAARGLDSEVISEFSIGYAPAAWDGLITHLTGRGVEMKDLEKSGLATRGERGTYDRFRDRIMFPIHDRRGRVIAFGGRALSDRGPKYLNSPETPVFHKGRELYRLHQVRRARDRADHLLVVEGYMDTVALFQHGFPNAVATLGTAVTADQVELMFRTVPEVVFCFDGDQAGERAAWRGLENALPALRAGRQIRFLFLPEGHDPDSLVRAEGQAGFQRRLQAAEPLSKFFFDRLSRDLDLESVDGRARLVALSEPLLRKLPQGPFSDLMRQALAERTGYASSEVTTRDSRPVERAAAQGKGRLTRVQFAIAMLVQNPGLVQGLDPEVLNVPGELKGVDFLKRLIDFCAARPHLSTAVLLEHWREAPEGPWLGRLAGRDLAIEPDTEREVLQDELGRIGQQMLESRIRRLQERQEAGGLSREDEQRLGQLLAEKARIRDSTE